MNVMSKRFFALLLVLGSGIWSVPAMGMDEESASRASVPASSDREGAEFTRLPVSWTVNPRDAANARAAWKTLSAYHRGKPKSSRKLHVVYVTFKDRPALDKYRERYDHLLKNIQAYYADQMQANGFPPLTFKLDLDDRGRLLLGRRSDTGEWAMVYGINEPGEQPADTVVREIKEETGIDAVVTDLVAVTSSSRVITYANGDNTMYMDHSFLCALKPGGNAEPYVGDEESLNVGWFELDDLPEPLAASTVERLKLFRRYLDNKRRGDAHAMFVADGVQR